MVGSSNGHKCSLHSLVFFLLIKVRQKPSLAHAQWSPASSSAGLMSLWPTPLSQHCSTALTSQCGATGGCCALAFWLFAVHVLAVLVLSPPG